MTKKIACLIGTRPEVIKMAPVIFELKKSSSLDVSIICTAQHRNLLDNTLSTFDIKPDIDLDMMKENQTLSQLTSELCLALTPIAAQKYDCWLVQGDTTTAYVASLMAFYHKTPVGHIEAGLRSGDVYQPFPEEMNRILISKLASWHFTPTHSEKENLLNEGIKEENIFTTGNTVIDALYWTINNRAPTVDWDAMGKILLVTVHRRESFGEPLRNICRAFKEIISRFPDVNIVYPVHPNPNVKQIIYQELQEIDRIHLLEPLPYDAFSHLMQKAHIIITDSGGIQEEAPALGKPVVVLREKTERSLVISSGLGQLAGTEVENIVNSVSQLLLDNTRYQKMTKGQSPYGDGHAAKRIVNTLQQQLLA